MANHRENTRVKKPLYVRIVVVFQATRRGGVVRVSGDIPQVARSTAPDGYTLKIDDKQLYILHSLFTGRALLIRMRQAETYNR